MRAIHTKKALDLWVSMYNAAAKGLATASVGPNGIMYGEEEIAKRATVIADRGFELLAKHVVVGSRADVFTHED